MITEQGCVFVPKKYITEKTVQLGLLSFSSADRVDWIKSSACWYYISGYETNITSTSAHMICLSLKQQSTTLYNMPNN